MDGVESVKQLDDTRLYWAAEVGGKRHEWEAKIVEQEPDRKIAWQSTDGKDTGGVVRFESLGPDRTRIEVEMSYDPEGVLESLGSALGSDSRRVKADLERFKELVESRSVESGAWRGEIRQGQETR